MILNFISKYFTNFIIKYDNVQTYCMFYWAILDPENLPSSNNYKNIHLNAQFFQEPVDLWLKTCDSDGKNILSYFYDDMKKHCYMFQSYAFITRFNQLHDIDTTKDIIFIERSSSVINTSLLKLVMIMIYYLKLNGSHNTWFDSILPKFKHIFDNAFFIYLQVSQKPLLNVLTKIQKWRK